MGWLNDLFHRFGRASRRSHDFGDDPEPGSWLSVGGVSIGLGSEPDRDHDGIPDSRDSDSGGSDSGDSDGGDSDGGDSDGGDSGGDD